MKTKIVVSNVLLAFFMILTGCETEDPKDEGPSQLLEQKAFSHTKKYDAVVATSWYNLLTGITRKTPYNPPQTARIFAYTGLALYESVVPGMPSHQSVFKQFSGNAITFEKKKDYYWPACANAALARIVTKWFAIIPYRILILHPFNNWNLILTRHLRLLQPMNNWHFLMNLEGMWQI